MTDDNDPTKSSKPRKKPGSEAIAPPTPAPLSLFDDPLPSWDSDSYPSGEHRPLSTDGEEVVNEFLGSLDGEDESIPPLPPLRIDPEPNRDSISGDELATDSLEEYGEMSQEVMYTSMEARVTREVDVPNAMGAQAAELSSDVLKLAARLVEQDDLLKGPLQFVDTVYNEAKRHTRTYVTSAGRPFFASLTLTYLGDAVIGLDVDVIFELLRAAPGMHMPHGTTGYQSVRHRAGVHVYSVRYERESEICDAQTGRLTADARQEVSHFVVELFAAASDLQLRVGVLSKETCREPAFDISDGSITMSYLRSWTP